MTFWYQKPAPRYLFHGSAFRHLKNINQKGLLAGTLERANFPDYAQDVVGYVSLCDTAICARRFAVYAKAEHNSENDYIVVIVDALRAKMHGQQIIPMKGKLSKDYGGHEWLVIGDIPREYLVGAYRYHYVNGKFTEDYIQF